MSQTALPTYTVYGQECEYEPAASVTTLSWFSIARCARERMTAHCGDIHRWRGERRSFYTALQMMEVEEVGFMD
jgi:hypothetical protein